MTAVVRRARACRVAAILLAVAALVGGVAPKASATTSGYNGKIAFIRGGELHTANADGTGVTNLNVAAYSPPAWSSGGARIGLTSTDGFVTMNADGSDQTVHSTSVGDFGTWSPDGTRLAFSRFVEGDGENIFVTDVEGANEIDLGTGEGGAELFPAWSPDGSKLAFQSNTSDAFTIWVMNADGTDAYEVPNQPDGSSGLPQFSPDGSKLVFANDPTGTDTTIQLYVIGVDGTGLTPVGPTNRYSSVPSFSPDGKKILFSSFAPSYELDAASGLYVMNADGSRRVQITRGYDDWAAWQPLTAEPANLAPRAFGFADNRLPLALLANADASFDIDGTIVSYEWRWGDNTAMTPKKYAWHRYAKAGTYLVRLTVRDDEGAYATKTAWIKVA